MSSWKAYWSRRSATASRVEVMTLLEPDSGPSAAGRDEALLIPSDIIGIRLETVNGAARADRRSWSGGPGPRAVRGSLQGECIALARPRRREQAHGRAALMAWTTAVLPKTSSSRSEL